MHGKNWKPTKTQKIKDSHSTLIMLDFTGKVRFADEGEALAIDVLKTNPLNMATKTEIHITIAYHQAQDLPDRIIETTKRWIGNLTIYKK